MKKLVFMFAAFAAISFASCGNEEVATKVNQDSIDSVKADSTLKDSLLNKVVKADTVWNKLDSAAQVKIVDSLFNAQKAAKK
jgi:hypothetical protein